VEEEAQDAGKTWNEVKNWQPTGPDGEVSQMPCASEGATGTKSSQSQGKFSSRKVLMQIMSRVKFMAGILNICCCSEDPGYIK
jgi:hypothetical protein